MQRSYTKRKKLLSIIAAMLTVLFAALLLTGCGGFIKDLLGYETSDPAEEEQALEEPEPESEPVSPASPEPGIWEQRLASWPMAFGFAGADGVRLILTVYGYDPPADAETGPDDNVPDGDTEDEDSLNFSTITGIDPDVYTLAIGPYGKIVAITLDGWQNETSNNNHLDNTNNFRNLPGFIYTATDQLFSKNETYLLTAACPLIDSLTALSPSGKKGYGSPMDNETIDSIRTLKNRGIEWGNVLAVTKNEGARIGIVLFERQGDDMLYSIVYMHEDKTLFWDCPAKYDESSTWWTDNGDDPGSFIPLFHASFDEGLVLALTWTGPKEEVVVFLIEENGAFVRSEDVSYKRTWR